MTAFLLRLIALVTMSLDHIGYLLLPEQTWLRCLGRISFPIFAFLLSEGHRHTRSKMHYALRLLLLAVLSEIPYDLMVFGVPSSPARQNVLWTFLLGVLMLSLVEVIIRSVPSPLPRGISIFFVVFFSSVTASLLRLDYGGLGILQIFAFYTLRDAHSGILAVCTLFLNLLMGGIHLQIAAFSIPMQALATLALFPISLYNGKKDPYNPFWSWLSYLFYPVHMLLLVLTQHLLY